MEKRKTSYKIKLQNKKLCLCLDCEVDLQEKLDELTFLGGSLLRMIQWVWVMAALSYGSWYAVKPSDSKPSAFS